MNNNSAATISKPTVNLDLSSNIASNSILHLGDSATIQINVGGTLLSVNSHTLLTPAEQLAAYQMMYTGQQSVILDTQGSASGGTVTLTSHLTQNLGNLVIPTGVTVIDLTKSGTLNLSGTLTDSGTLDISSTNSSVNHVTVDATNINVQSQGLLTNTLTATNALAGGAAQNQGLVLNAQNNIANSGTISSAGMLSLNAGGTISNTTAAPTASNALANNQPLIQGAENVNLSTGSGVINNSGLIQSNSGNINITSQPAQSISVNSSNGIFQATNGSINVRDALYTGAANTNLNGGSYLSQALNLNSGTGNANTAVNSISGLLHINAEAANTQVSSGTLQLGAVTVNGDPTFYNTGGNITIGGNITSAGDLSIVASGDILSNGNYSITASNGAAGAQINLIAGANITAAPGNSPIVGPFPGTGNPAGAPITVTGPSASGGSVTFSGHDMAISTVGAAGNNSGSDVKIVAFASSTAPSSGTVDLSAGTTVNTGGTGSGNNGNIQILAGAASGTAITTGNLNTVGGTGTGGNINLQTAQPNTGSVPIGTNGTVATGAFDPSGATNAASINVNGGLNSSGSVTMSSANTVTVNGSVSSQGNITIASPADLTIAGTGSLNTTASGTVSLLASSAGSQLTVANGTALTVNGGGTVHISTPNLVLASTGNNPSITATGASNVLIDAGTSAANVDLTITGPSGNAGTISTNGGLIDISPTGLGNLSFQSSGLTPTTLNFNTSGSGFLTMHGLGNITIPAGVTVASVSPIQVNMNNFFLNNQTFTLSGTLETTFNGNSAFPDPLGGSMFYSLLIQNLFSNFTLAGNGTLLQAGATPGNTVFNDFTDVGFANGTNLHITSVNPGSFANFYTRQIQLNGLGISSSNLILNNINAVNFNTNLPSFGPGNVAFVGGAGTLIENLNILGAPVNVGFQGSPPVSIPAMQQLVANIFVTPGFILDANKSINMSAANSINLLGVVASTAGNININSPSTNIYGPGAVISGASNGLIQFQSFASGGPVNVVDDGIIIAPGASSVVGFNGGPTGAISVVGNGSILANEINLGNLNPTTLQLIGPFVTLNEFDGSFSLGNITITQGGIHGTVSVSEPRAGTSGSSTASSNSTTTSNSANSNGAIFANASAAALASTQAFQTEERQLFGIRHQNRLDESIGTRIATDYTPVRWLPSSQFPLEGKITANQEVEQSQSIFSGIEFTANELVELNRQGVGFSTDSKGAFLGLTKGDVLFMPKGDIRVKTTNGTAYIPKGATAWIMETGSDTAIYDLHDTLHTGSIKIEANGKQIVLSPGKEVLLTKTSGADFASLNPGKSIGYRHVQSATMGDGITAFVCDFSIAHGVATVPIIRNLLVSNDPSRRNTASKMIKNAAILADLTGEEYQTNQ